MYLRPRYSRYAVEAREETRQTDYVSTGYEPFDLPTRLYSTFDISTLKLNLCYFPRKSHFIKLLTLIVVAMKLLLTKQMEVSRLSSMELYNRPLHSYYTYD